MATASQPVEGRSDALRIVLFGMPQAGKSSLLGALAQAAQTQDSVLAGQLVDQSKGLEVLRRRLYEGKAQETLEEVAPYPVTFESFTGSRETASVAEAVLYDCNGHVANELLSRRQTLGDDSGDGALAKAILNADALILVVDASADAGTLRRTFGQFSNFLRLLEQRLGQRAEVGGLPVYLVLSKCDLLAQPGDTSSAWIDRIEDRKREVHDQFQEFLSEEAARERRPLAEPTCMFGPLR